MTNAITMKRSALLALVAICASSASAQTPAASARWNAWIGCWQPTESVAPSNLLCVTPVDENSVRLRAVVNGKVTVRDTLTADGAQHPVSREGCTGWQRARWSADGRRVFTKSELTCTGNIKRTTSGILSIAPDGEWVDVQGVSAGGNTGVRANHYQPAFSESAVPKEIADILAGKQLARSTARTAAGTRLLGHDLLEAVGELDSTVVAAWLIERGQAWDVDAKSVVAWADAGVPASAPDVLAGLASPERFARKGEPTGGGGGYDVLTARDSSRLASQYLRDQCFTGLGSWLYSPYGFDPCLYSYGYGYSRYRYNPYGYYGGGYGPYYGGGGITYVPVVVVKEEPQSHGRVVNGHGYSSGTGSTGSDGSRTTSSGSSGSSSSGSSGSSGSGGSSSGSSSSSSSGGGRTAH